jgi:hypothetical protein
MNKNFVLPLLIVLVIFTPISAGAQSHSDYSWHDYPVITPSGPPDIIFPVQGGASFYNDFNQLSNGARIHSGNDLMAPKMTPILAARGGRVSFAPMTEPDYGYMISIAGDDGYKYNYIHINNDTPGTDDGLGGAQNAYAPGIQQGAQVIQGQQIAWVGDSGNAESTVPHLHFEIRLPDDTPIDPYQYLKASLKIYIYDIFAVKTASPDINTDKSLVANPAIILYCTPGSLIRTTQNTSVYYCGADGKRYVFPNAKVYATWYKDFSTVQTIAPEDLANIPLGGNATYRPGMKLVKIQTDPKVYAVDKNGTLRWMSTSALAVKYYGASWAKSVEDIPDAFFASYKIGQPVTD